MKISIIGAGAWGTTLARILANNGHQIKIWAFEKEVVEQINQSKENKTYLNGFSLPEQIKAFISLEESLKDSSLIFMVVPSEHFRRTVKSAAPYLKDQTLVIASKGIEIETGKTLSKIAEEETPLKKIAILSGPNLSKEIAAGKPAATVIASKSKKIAEEIQKIIMNENFRVYTSEDITATELGGALKNVIAIAAGISDGLNLGDNAKASLLIRAMAEISRLGIKLNARCETFFGLSGMGDLIATCSSSLSRNHQVGFRIGKGEKLADIKKDMKAVAEGVPTCKAAFQLSQKLKVEMPITEQVYKVLFENKDPSQALFDLMTRKPKKEVE